MTPMNKIKLTVDSLLIAFGIAIVSCATQVAPTLESPSGRWVIHEKDDYGKVKKLYYTDKYIEHFTPESYIAFVDKSGRPQKVKSYDVFKQ